MGKIFSKAQLNSKLSDYKETHTDPKIQPVLNLEQHLDIKINGNLYLPENSITSNDTKSERRLSVRYASPDSFDRFDNELCELLLSFLSFEEKIKYECVSRQWRKCIFNRQTVLRISHKGRHDTLPQLLIYSSKSGDSHQKSDESVIGDKALQCVLKKCKNIRKIDTTEHCTSNRALFIIATYCKQLEEMGIICHLTANRKTIAKFGESCGAKFVNFISINNMRHSLIISHLLGISPFQSIKCIFHIRHTLIF